MKKIGIIGAGAWGTALAQTFADKGHAVKLWMRHADLTDAINKTHVNGTYLPDIVLNKDIQATTDLKLACAADILVFVTPSQHLADIVAKAAPYIAPNTPLILASKGIEVGTGRLLSQIVDGIFPDHPLGILTGPSFAIEVAKGLPTALTLAFSSPHEDLAYELCDELATPHFRLYVSDDIIGAQVGGAVKNVIAIACGIAEGKEMGHNARAALQTRGLAEMVRLGAALGAEAQTFLGLSGLGDLTLTCNAMQSRNFSLGVAIGQGARAADILADRATVAEGYYTAAAVHDLANKLQVEMPISHAVFEALYHEKAVDYVIKKLLSRPIKAE